MDSEILKIPKRLKQVMLWIHPEGQVIGSLFLREQSMEHTGCEKPLEVLNQDQPFIVLKRDDPDDLRFYNRASIIRIEYEEASNNSEVKPLPCRLHMMDGSIIDGAIREELSPDQARLYDYINQKDDRFIKVHTNDSEVCLVNKSYIIRIRATDE